jgi:hypothetical protein
MYNIQDVFNISYDDYAKKYNPSQDQQKAALAIINCKSGNLGCNFAVCDNCGHSKVHNNSCRNRNCPCCQAYLRDIWVDSRKSEVIDAPYFHVVFTLPSELNPIIYSNQSLLYSLMNKAASKTLLELSADKKFLGATPGIIQLLHTWGSRLNFHPHIHCIVTGAGLTKTKHLKKSAKNFFIPVKILGKVFRGKFLEQLQKLYQGDKLKFSTKYKKYKNSYEWKELRNNLYNKNWIPYIKETFNGFGNAIDYLGRYTHHIAISNSRVVSLSDTHITFKAKNYKTDKLLNMTLTHLEFIRRFMMHVLPSGFHKIRYYGFLNNRYKKINLKIIVKLTGKDLPQPKFISMTKSEIIYEVCKIDITKCPMCGKKSMRYAGRTYYARI